jgi:hypothetical protein
MKKIFSLFILVILFSCKKDDSYCWQCRTVTVTNYPEYIYVMYGITITDPAYTDTRTDIENICDKTEKEIDTWEKLVTSSSNTDNPYKLCVCTKTSKI